MGRFVRQNWPLLLGLLIAIVVLVARPIGRVLDAVNDIERQTQLRFLPGLVVLAVAYLFHDLRRRHESQAQTAVAAAAMEVAKRESARRAAEIQRLALFGNAVARALDHDKIREAINLHLSRMMGTDQLWVLIRQGPGWQVLSGEVDQKLTLERQDFAERLLSGDNDLSGAIRDPRRGFPLVGGETPMGVLGIDYEGRIDEDRQRTLEAAASLIAVSLRNVQLFSEIHESSIRDGLTGLWTRTHAIEVLDGELRRARRSQLPVSVILFDLDHFKGVNDRYGHLCGDTVLAQVAQRMTEVLRSSDLKCRYGGEEFLAVLPATTLHGAGCVAETLRRELEAKPITWAGEVLTVTASIGVSQSEPGELDIPAIIGRADAALYRAKEQGRNRVRLEPDHPPPPTRTRAPDDPAE